MAPTSWLALVVVVLANAPHAECAINDERRLGLKYNPFTKAPTPAPGADDDDDDDDDGKANVLTTASATSSTTTAATTTGTAPHTATPAISAPATTTTTTTTTMTTTTKATAIAPSTHLLPCKLVPAGLPCRREEPTPAPSPAHEDEDGNVWLTRSPTPAPPPAAPTPTPAPTPATRSPTSSPTSDPTKAPPAAPASKAIARGCTTVQVWAHPKVLEDEDFATIEPYLGMYTLDLGGAGARAKADTNADPERRRLHESATAAQAAPANLDNPGGEEDDDRGPRAAEAIDAVFVQNTWMCDRAGAERAGSDRHNQNYDCDARSSHRVYSHSAPGRIMYDAEARHWVLARTESAKMLGAGIIATGPELVALRPNVRANALAAARARGEVAAEIDSLSDSHFGGQWTIWKDVYVPATGKGNTSGESGKSGDGDGASGGWQVSSLEDALRVVCLAGGTRRGRRGTQDDEDHAVVGRGRASRVARHSLSIDTDEDGRCARVRHSSSCSPDGPYVSRSALELSLEPRNPAADGHARGCLEQLPSGAAGVCACESGAEKAFACGHTPFTCASMCELHFPLVLAQSDESRATNQLGVNLLRRNQGNWLSPENSNQWVIFDLGARHVVEAVVFDLWGSSASPRHARIQRSELDSYAFRMAPASGAHGEHGDGAQEEAQLREEVDAEARDIERANADVLLELQPWLDVAIFSMPRDRTTFTQELPTTPMKQGTSGSRYWRMLFVDNWGATYGLGLNEVRFKLHGKQATREMNTGAGTVAADIAVSAARETSQALAKETAKLEQLSTKLSNYRRKIKKEGTEMASEVAMVSRLKQKDRAQKRAIAVQKARDSRMWHDLAHLGIVAAGVCVLACVLCIVVRRSRRNRAKVVMADSASQYSMSDATIGVRFKPEPEHDGLPALGPVSGAEGAPLLATGTPLKGHTSTIAWEQTQLSPQLKFADANMNAAPSEGNTRPAFSDAPPPDVGIGRYDDTV